MSYPPLKCMASRACSSSVCSRRTCFKKHEFGFTILELLITLILIGIITTIAMPAMKTVTRRSEALEIASQLSQLLNLAKDQSTRRNRAYQVVIDEFNLALPQGRLELNEAASNTCQSIIERPNLIKDLKTLPFGSSVVANEQPSIRPFVGLFGWKQTAAQEWQSSKLELCINPKGGTFVRSGDLFTELTGHLNIGIQQYFGDPLRKLGPPYQVEMTFSSGAKVKR